MWLGGLIAENEGALWKAGYFIHKKGEELDKVIIAMDPSGSDAITADEAGIIVAGKIDDRAWILEDFSGRLSPLDQCRNAVKLYYDYDAEYIVVEKNGVGAGFKTILKQVDKKVPIREVIAVKGKKLRAYPVASLYQEGKVFHDKTFNKLEYEMLTWDEEVTSISPGRLDATVYAVTDLLVDNKKKMQIPKIQLSI